MNSVISLTLLARLLRLSSSPLKRSMVSSCRFCLSSSVWLSDSKAICLFLACSSSSSQLISHSMLSTASRFRIFSFSSLTAMISLMSSSSSWQRWFMNLVSRSSALACLSSACRIWMVFSLPLRLVSKQSIFRENFQISLLLLLASSTSRCSSSPSALFSLLQSLKTSLSFFSSCCIQLSRSDCLWLLSFSSANCYLVKQFQNSAFSRLRFSSCREDSSWLHLALNQWVSASFSLRKLVSSLISSSFSFMRQCRSRASLCSCMSLRLSTQMRRSSIWVCCWLMRISKMLFSSVINFISSSSEAIRSAFCLSLASFSSLSSLNIFLSFTASSISVYKQKSFQSQLLMIFLFFSHYSRMPFTCYFQMLMFLDSYFRITRIFQFQIIIF